MSTQLKEWLIYIFAAIIVLGEIAMIGFVLVIWMVGASTFDANVVNLIYGLALGYHSAFMIIIGYFFGSSKGSQDKNALIGKPSPDTTEPGA